MIIRLKRQLLFVLRETGINMPKKQDLKYIFLSTPPDIVMNIRLKKQLKEQLFVLRKNGINISLKRGLK